MKKITLSVVLFLAILALVQSARANEVEQTSVVGKWSLKNRACVSGKATADKFLLGRDSLKFEIAGTEQKQKMKSELSLDGKTEVQSSKLELRGIATQLKNPFTGKNDIIIFNQPTNDELEVYSAGFEEGEVCAKGDALKSVFVRVKNTFQAGI
jgi:hypothetical protein